MSNQAIEEINRMIEECEAIDKNESDPRCARHIVGILQELIERLKKLPQEQSYFDIGINRLNSLSK